MKMKMSFRWYGKDDPVSLEYISQIPGMRSVVSAVYDVAPGKVWPRESLEKIKKSCEENGLIIDIVESVPVHEDIKLKQGDYQLYIDNYKENETYKKMESLKNHLLEAFLNMSEEYKKASWG